jgi:predicted RNA-binding Zn-ribbon protein involved in translation (DUF1610 family)
MSNTPPSIQYLDYSFTCPECGKHVLNVQMVYYRSAQVQKIKWNGLHDEGVIKNPSDNAVDSWEEYYQCAGCGEIFHTLDELLATGHLKLIK